ncbi:hypothetical protein ES677_09775 [Bizionia gelidisalsuginis]|uniref:Uncharacterized protein n=2 Tax=Bizionia TaxID=283785 RepID=A0A8H2QK08_9FLAO|nr:MULTISPECIES: hypothetical protein [Bizionia]TYB76813.1 hypothetical protein ES676_05585 [Bizionia saleffrena]TYC12045.1 hypothetical protein ES677_09775 [Bizionia gelidisalsuginis]
MELIQNNPYRIAGILSNATAKEVQKNKSKFLKFAEVGKRIESEYDFNSSLQLINRDKDNLAQAFSQIQQSQDKVNFSLFWFLNANPYDNTAIEYLKNGDKEKAVEIWEKVTRDKGVNSKNFSAFNNLGTFKLLSHRKEDIKEGLEAKIKLIESECFREFVLSVADETVKINKDLQIEKFVDELLKHFKSQYSNLESLQMFSNCNGSTQKYISRKFTEEPIHFIESQIESTKNKRNKNKSNAFKYGLDLAAMCKKELVLLQSLTGTTDLKYKTIADQLASEIMQCGIDYFNASLKNDANENYLEFAIKLTKIADRIAVGKLTKDRAKDNLVTLAEMKDQELSEAIEILKTIVNAYKNNERKILKQVREEEASMSYGQSINYSKVSELIKNSIDWDKATEIINKVIPKENIAKIKRSQDSSKISEYKSLVESVLERMSYTNRSRVEYLQYWESTRVTKKRESTSTSSYKDQTTTSSTDGEGIPLWLKWAGAILFFFLLVKSCS